MEKDLVKVDRDYVIARLIETLDDLILAVEFWNRGFARNSAGKVFSSVKALLSALVTRYQERLLGTINDAEEAELIRKMAHVVPTHAMRGIAMLLNRIGIDVEKVANLAYLLHEYQYNGFEPGFSSYSRKREVLRDISAVISSIPSLVEKYFPEEARLPEVMELLVKLKEVKMKE